MGKSRNRDLYEARMQQTGGDAEAMMQMLTKSKHRRHLLRAQRILSAAKALSDARNEEGADVQV